MKKRKIFKIVIWTLSVSIVLFAVLIVHIAMVTKPVHYDNSDLQLSRIDFKETIDPAEAAKIRHFVVSLPGVENAVFNLKDQTLVYGYTTNKQSSENIFDKLMLMGHYNAQRFVPTMVQLNSGCPMGKSKDSFIYTLSSYVARWL